MTNEPMQVTQSSQLTKSSKNNSQIHKIIKGDMTIFNKEERSKKVNRYHYDEVTPTNTQNVSKPVIKN